MLSFRVRTYPRELNGDRDGAYGKTLEIGSACLVVTFWSLWEYFVGQKLLWPILNHAQLLENA